MASFCAYCGRPLADGEVCSCMTAAAEPEYDPQAYQPMDNAANEYYSAPPAPRPRVEKKQPMARGFLDSLRNHFGIGYPTTSLADPYEEGKQIVPDSVTAMDGELPGKQYKVAALKKYVFGIPYAKATGRIQVTNKRLLYRAAGTGFFGTTEQQQEFSLRDLYGVSVRKGHFFSIGHFLVGALLFYVGGLITDFLISKMSDSITAVIIFTFILGTACLVPFALLKRKWPLKILALGGSFFSFLTYGAAVYAFESEFLGIVFYFLAAIALAAALISHFAYALRPNLVICFKTITAGDAVCIRRRRLNIFGNGTDEHTGFSEVAPLKDVETFEKEINALLSEARKAR